MDIKTKNSLQFLKPKAGLTIISRQSFSHQRTCYTSLCTARSLVRMRRNMCYFFFIIQRFTNNALARNTIYSISQLDKILGQKSIQLWYIAKSIIQYVIPLFNKNYELKWVIGVCLFNISSKKGKTIMNRNVFVYIFIYQTIQNNKGIGRKST